MSKRVIFTCSLLLLGGIGGGFEMLSSMLRGDLSFNVFVLFLPVSIALFLAVPGARWMATAVLAIAYLVLGAILLAPLLAEGRAVVRLCGVELPFANAWPVVLVFVATVGSLLALVHWMLYSPVFDDHLER